MASLSIRGVRKVYPNGAEVLKGIDLEIADGELCCGSAGIYNILQPEPARELGDRKARNVLATGASLLVTANPGCLMQVASSIERLGGQIRLAHTAEVLDASIRGLPPEQLGHARSGSTPHDVPGPPQR